LSSQNEPEGQRKRCKSHPAKRPKTHRKHPRTSLPHGMSFQFSVWIFKMGRSRPLSRISRPGQFWLSAGFTQRKKEKRQ
jgi:hypothetical protein